MSCSNYHKSVEKKGLNENWSFRMPGEDKDYPARVPGCVHTDLLANGKTGDPYYRDNELNLQWIEEENWTYKCEFNIDDPEWLESNTELVFEGLDTYAEVYLNDTLIAETGNMFREYVFECAELLQNGNNCLKVNFKSPVKKIKELSRDAQFRLPDERGFARKAPYHFGWDWGPRFVTSGIWRDVYLRKWESLRIKDIFIRQNSVNEDKAKLEVTFEIESDKKQIALLFIADKETEKVLVNQRHQLRSGLNAIKVDLVIDNPRLWWPNGWGKPERYHFNFLVRSDGAIDEKSIRYGIRTVELVREKDEYGESFYFSVNGHPLFIKGANYIPQESFPSSVSKKQYARLIRSAKNANMNMIRVWGGGIYENDIFYDLCDENGILVWQDFMFACNLYPGNEEFLQNVRIEAEENIRRLRNHPCLALWCGNNEIGEAWENWGWQRRLDYSETDSIAAWQAYERLFHELLPSVVEKLDPETDYWPSSPLIGWGHEAAFKKGDAHYWGVWWGEEPFEMYEKKVGRFMSEFGFQGMPEMKTINSFTLKEDQRIGSPVMQVHQKHPRGTELIRLYMERDFPVPENFEDYVYVSQIVQAYGIGKALEAHRRSKPYCMGTLYWQLNDCWPVTSWSGIDYFGRWKALHYDVKRIFENVSVSISYDDLLHVHVINDNLESTTVKLETGAMDFHGLKIWENISVFQVEPNTSEQRIVLPVDDILKNRNKRNILFYARLMNEDTVLSSGSYYFVPVKDLDLPPVEIKRNYGQIKGGYRLQLHSEFLAKDVMLYLKDIDGFFSVNHFDILPGDTVSIEVYGDFSLDELAENLEVYTINEIVNNVPADD